MDIGDKSFWGMCDALNGPWLRALKRHVNKLFVFSRFMSQSYSNFVALWAAWCRLRLV